MKEEIMDYLKRTYHPDAVITYGSYQDGTFNQDSDFDALIIADTDKSHDESVIAGVVLDVFIYSPLKIREASSFDEFIPIYDGKIEFDNKGDALRLKENVIQYVNSIPFKSDEEIHQEKEWCRKMLLRSKRNDAEGNFRFHWLLTESLEIYYDMKKKRYWGPKKALKEMFISDNKAYQIYEKALINYSFVALSSWIDYILSMD